MKAKEKDNRVSSRLKFQVLIEYDANDSHMTFDYCYDFSEGGLFIETLTPLPQNQIMKLKFKFPHNSEPFVTDAIVRWVRTKAQAALGPAGMGISFINQSDQDKEIIKKNIALYEDYLKAYFNPR